MQPKQHLSARFDVCVMERLNTLSRALNLPVSDAVSHVLDVYEEQKNSIEVQEAMLERLENLEQTITFMLDVLTAVNQKMTEASDNEKERLKSLFLYLKQEMDAHDKAEKERFSRIDPRG